jgi:hypothetical protein
MENGVRSTDCTQALRLMLHSLKRKTKTSKREAWLGLRVLWDRGLLLEKRLRGLNLLKLLPHPPLKS